MKTIKGPAIFLAQFAGDAAPFNTLDSICRLGRRPRLQGRADPDLGRAPVRPRKGGDEPRPTATSSRASLAQARRRDHRAVDPPAGPAGRGASGLRHAVRRLRAAPRCAAIPKARQDWAVEQLHAGGQGVAATSASTRTRPSPARWPGPTSIRGRSARPGLIEEAFDELARALDADPRRLRRGRRRRLLRDPSRRGPARRRHLRDVPRARRATTRAPTCSTTRATSCCSSSTISTTSTSTTSASRCSTSRTPSSIRPAGRASMAATRPGSNRAGRFRSLGDGQVDFAGDLLQAGAVRLRRLGRARMGMLPQASRGRRARRRARSSRDHIIRVTEKAFDDFAGGGTDQAANRKMLGIAEREAR